MMSNPETDAALINELAKILFLLDKRGYIQSDLPDEENDVYNMRLRAKDAVKRARARLGLGELK